MPDKTDVPRFRFNLRHVFYAVTGLCVVCAVTAPVASQGVVIYVGTLAAVANYLGAFSWFQAHGRRHWVWPCVLLVFAVSLFLPAFEIKIFGGKEEVPGWLAAVMTPLKFVEMAIDGFSNLAYAGTAIVLLLVCVGQVGFLLYFAAQLRGHVFTFKLAHRLLILGNAAAWCWLVYFPIVYSSERDSVLVGYYVWCASMMIAMNAARIDTVRFLLLIGTITMFMAQFLVLRAVA